MIDMFGLSTIPTTSFPPLLSMLLTIPVLVVSICLCTWITTSWNFSRSISQFRSRSSTPAAQAKPIPPPLLPYAVPWLGSAVSFLNENPGSFWRMLRGKLANTGTNVQVVTILLGGKKAHVVNSATAVQTLFKTKHVSRDIFNHQLAINALGTSRSDAERMWAPAGPYDLANEKGMNKKDAMEALNHEFLLSSTAATSLTNKFLECFQSTLRKADVDQEWKTINLFSWWKQIMFHASTTALMGTKILEMNPDLAEQFWEYDAGLLVRFYGIPKFMKPAAYTSLEGMLDRTQDWVEYVQTKHNGHPPEEPDWEPLLGSKVMRARHRFYNREGISARGKAAFDLGFLFGLQSNVIPITSWMLAHLLSPCTPGDVLQRIQREIQKAQKSTGEIDIWGLAAAPLLHSALHETMRLYVDSLITRQLTMDMIVDGFLLRKDDLIMAPSSLSQNDAKFWERDNGPPADEWYAERFLKHDPETGKDTFSTVWASGKFFPFGGGSHICPGRVFAKQEILGALATLLAQFEIQFVEYLGTDKKGNVVGLGRRDSAFPKAKQQYAGNGTVSMGGDIRVRMRRR